MPINILQFTEVLHLHVNSRSKLSIPLIVLSDKPVGGKYDLLFGIVVLQIFFTHQKNKRWITFTNSDYLFYLYEEFAD